MSDDRAKRYYLDSRKDIIPLISPDVDKILDIGCGGGMLGKELKKMGNLFVAGVEMNTEAARIAKENLDKVIEGDIENLNLPFEEGYFDCIVMADILEHLKEPWSVLKYLKRFLNKTGIAIISIPNARHYSVSIQLLLGKMKYQEDGLLDATHLHLFTLSSIKKMLIDTGYNIVDIKCKIKEGWKVRLLNRIFLGIFKGFITFQYIITATKIV